jgi:hypothetical protein
MASAALPPCIQCGKPSNFILHDVVDDSAMCGTCFRKRARVPLITKRFFSDLEKNPPNSFSSKQLRDGDALRRASHVVIRHARTSDDNV